MHTLRFTLAATLVCFVASAPAGIRNFSAEAFITADVSLTNTVNDVPFRDSDATTLGNSGGVNVAAAFTRPGLGTATAMSGAGFSSSDSNTTANVTFNWSGDGNATIDDPIPNSFKQVGCSAGGSVTIHFEVV
ncbi:MAG: hypothetical protein AB7N71_12180, partial [Phycisphaerae bacterium]